MTAQTLPRSFGPAFVAALQALGGNEPDFLDTPETTAAPAPAPAPVVRQERPVVDRRFAGMIQAARFSASKSFPAPESEALFCNVNALLDLGFDVEPLALCMRHEKLAPKFVATLIDNVRDGSVGVAQVNTAVRMVQDTHDVRELYREESVWAAFGFDVKALRSMIDAGMLNGVSLRSLLFRVCVGRLDIVDANTGLHFNTVGDDTMSQAA